MPVFIPINPPAQQLAQFGEAVSTPGSAAPATASLVRVEEKVRDLVLEYQAALKAWAKGLLCDARDGLERLCDNALVCQEQQPQLESECNAYCVEYGGVPMARLRFLVFANMASLHIAIAGGQALASLEGFGAEPAELDPTRIPIGPDMETALTKALAFLTLALQFGPADTAHYLTMGRCAMLLGQLDIAMSAFTSGIGPVLESLWLRGTLSYPGAQSYTHAEQAIRRRLGPRQLWCIKAIVQTLLARGDAELACMVASQVGEMCPDMSHLLCLIPSLQRPVLAMAPAPALLFLNTLAPAMLPEQAAMKKAAVLDIRADNGRVSLAELGAAILKVFEESTEPTLDVASAFFSCVDVAISESATTTTDDMAPADSIQDAISREETDAVGSIGSVDIGNVATERPPTCEAPASTFNAERDNASADEASSGYANKSNKRCESPSGDEMPAKRRSTRFIERATSGVSGNVSSSALSTAVSGSSVSRAAAVRSSQRKAPTLLLDAAESPAYSRARDLAGTWLEAAGLATRSEFAAALSASIFAASVVAQNACLARGASSKSSVPQNTLACDDDKAEWGLADICSKDKGVGSKRSLLSDTHAECPSSGGVSVESRYIDSLTALLKPCTARKAPGHLGLASSAIAGMHITSGECQAALADNHGTVDLLLRFIEMVALRFYCAPTDFVKFKGLKQQCLRVVHHVFDVLLDLVATRISLSESTDAFRHAMQYATFVLLLLADAIASQPQSRAKWASLQAAWARAMCSSMAAAKTPSSDQCAVQYLLSESWTCYQIDVLEDDVSSAIAHIDKCLSLLELLDSSGAVCVVASCVFSGEPLTLELARERRQHLAQFIRLSEACRLAAAGEERAVVRLLASLHRRQSAALEESRVIMYELSLYLSRLLACHAGTTMPAQTVIVRSVECLRRLYELAEGGSAVGQYPGRAVADGRSNQLSTQLVAVSLAIACHYPPDPAQECSSTAVEADFVGLAIWLASKLGWGKAPTMSSNTCLETAADFDEVAPLSCYTEFLGAAHELIGERGICMAAGGALLKHLLVVCRQSLDLDRDNLPCWDMAASCLRCLFDIRLHSSNARVHACEHLDMDPQCANLVYLLVEPELVDATRNRKGTGLRSDLKAILDKAANALGELDVEKHPRVSMNLDIIDDYLDGTSMPSFAHVDRVLRAGALELPDSRLPLRHPVYDSGFCKAYLSLPFVRAAAQHESLLFRMRSGMTRAVEDYDKIIEDYRLNIALGAESSEAWYHLGRAYSDLADEMLLGTVSEIAECKYDIALLQRRSLSCAIQASQQLPPLLTSRSANKEKQAAPAVAPDASVVGAINSNSDDTVSDVDSDSSASQGEGSSLALKLRVRVASSTGHLLYRTAAKPLSLLAFRVLPANVLVSDDGTESGQQWDVGAWSSSCDRGVVRNLSSSLTKRYSMAPRSHRVYVLARIMFSRASKLDASNWEWPYMLGKVAAKLGDSLTACALYLKASHLAVAAGSKSSVVGANANSGQAHGSATSSAAIPEIAMDALCKLLTVVTKLVLSEQMDAATARRFVAALPPPCVSTVEAGVASLLFPDPPPESNMHRGSGAPAKPVRDPEMAAVLCAIRSIVSQLCASDKRRRHHRSMFLLSWIDHHVLGESERAKQALSTSLLNMRASTKQLAGFYKTDFEAPGKHYIYLEKYLALYVETLVDTLDISGVQLVLRKLGRSSDSLYTLTVLQQQTAAAELEILQRMAGNLNCPKFVVDGLGKEHIILHDALNGASSAQIFSITRHCRLNRAHFTHARDIARDNISFYIAQRQHLDRLISTVSTSSVVDSGCVAELGQIRQAFDQYLAASDKAVLLFGFILDHKKKRAEEPETIDKLHDCLADAYMLILSVYGQCLRTTQLPPRLPHQELNIDEATASFRNMGMQLVTSPSLKRSEGVFWQNVIFDDTRHEPSQQYRLLDPLLEFQVNKLLDAVRDATLPQPSQLADKPRFDSAGTLTEPPALPREESIVPLVQAQQDTLTAANVERLD
ncbi:Histone transcription regulator 3 [Coemansia sp. BCRC 34301]|nr:Histone transcription regulator 3 [Coemansia sp. BCRC 34301]